MQDTLTTISHQDGKVVLPFTKDQFEAFIKNLLGQPQRLSRHYSRPFRLDHSGLTQISYLIQQRVSQQNPAQLVDLTIDIRFSDDSTISFKSLEAATSYNELKLVVARSVSVSWVFLMQFPGRPAPERQEVYLEFAAMGRHEYRSYEGITLEIRHSVRTWACDIEALVTNFVDTIVISEARWRIFIRNYSQEICRVVAFFLFAGSIATVYFSATRMVDSINSTLRDPLDSASTFESRVEAYLRYVSDASNSLAMTKFGFQTLVFVLATMVFSMFLFERGYRFPSAFQSRISFTAASIKLSDQQDKRLGTMAKRYLFMLCGSLALGVASNYIYGWLTKP